MTKSRRPQSLPQRFFQNKLGKLLKKYFTVLRIIVAGGLFVLLLAVLLQQHAYRFNLQPAIPQENAIEITYPESSIECNGVKCPSIAYENAWQAQMQDEDYVRHALVMEEPVENKYIMADEIDRGVSFPQHPLQPELMAGMTRIDKISAPSKHDEEDYSHYEETLPQDIIDEGKPSYISHANHRKISDMKIKVHSKPPYFGPHPVIAVVIDDMGDNVRRTRDISSLRAPLTASFLTYPPHIESQVAKSLAAGHEIMVHVPMQPKSNVNMTSDILTVEMTPDEVLHNFRKMLTKFHDIKGINNHMGSRLTEDRPRMEEIMKELKKRELFFLDSKTTPHSVGDVVARQYGVDYATRNVFLDNTNELNYILKQLAQTERVARKNGYAIAIGHPKSQTYEALKQWLPTLEQKHIKLVHLSRIVSALNRHPDGN